MWLGSSMIDLTFKYEEALKPYRGPDINQKFPGEDDLIWCDRCKVNHRRGAGWEVEQERIIQRAARQIAKKIDAQVLEHFSEEAE